MMRELIETIFGQYQPVYTDSFTTDGAFNGAVVASGAAGVDWMYIAGVAVFAITLYSLFRIIGGLLKNG